MQIPATRLREPVHAPTSPGGLSCPVATGASAVKMTKKQKRKANSPCENLVKTKPRIVENSKRTAIVSPVVKTKTVDTSTDSPKSAEMNSTLGKMDLMMDLSGQMFDTFNMRVVTRNGEPFEGALTRPQCFSIWKEFHLPRETLYGIALIQVPDKPFMATYQLNESIDLMNIPPEIKVSIDGNEYGLALVIPRDPPPTLGENFDVTVKATRFKVTLAEVDKILAKFGTITKPSKHVEDKDADNCKTDDVLCIIKLRKHIPSFLPGFGRKLMIRYYGQPLQCSKCFNPGHLRKKCPNETVDWLRFVRLIVDEKVLNLELLGSWANAIGYALPQDNNQSESE